jgi:branched-chain amino acid transport system substrate-binding protein
MEMNVFRFFKNIPTTGLAASALALSLSTAAVAQSSNPIRIGVVLSRTGPASSLGTPAENAIRLRVEQINATGGINGRRVEVRYEDDESRPDRAAEATRAIITGFKPYAIVGSSVVATCNAMKPITEEAKVPQWCLSGLPMPASHPFFFAAFVEPGWVLGDLPVTWMKKRGYSRIACLASDDASGQTISKAVRGAVAASQGLTYVGTETFAASDVDVTTQLVKLRGKVDIIYGCTTGKQVVTLLQGIRQLGMNVPVFLGAGNAGYVTAQLIKDVLVPAGVYTSGEKIHVADQLDKADPQKAALDAFSAAYKAKYQAPPDFFAAIAWDNIDMLVRAISTLGEPTGQQLVSHMESAGRFVSVAQPVRYDSKVHRPQPDLGIILQFTPTGSFKLVETIAAKDMQVLCTPETCSR